MKSEQDPEFGLSQVKVFLMRAPLEQVRDAQEVIGQRVRYEVLLRRQEREGRRISRGGGDVGQAGSGGPSRPDRPIPGF